MTNHSDGQAALYQEVRELTTLMRTDSDFADIRDVLNAKGLSPTDALLAGLISGEDDSQYGVLVVDAGQCIVFETDSRGLLIRWEFVDDISSLDEDFDAVAVGVEIKLNGEVL